MYCFTPVSATSAAVTDPSGYNLLPAGSAACFSLPLNVGAGSLPPEYAASQPVAFVPAEHILVAGAKVSLSVDVIVWSGFIVYVTQRCLVWAVTNRVFFMTDECLRNGNGFEERSL